MEHEGNGYIPAEQLESARPAEKETVDDLKTLLEELSSHITGESLEEPVYEEHILPDNKILEIDIQRPNIFKIVEQSHSDDHPYQIRTGYVIKDGVITSQAEIMTGTEIQAIQLGEALNNQDLSADERLDIGLKRDRLQQLHEVETNRLEASSYNGSHEQLRAIDNLEKTFEVVSDTEASVLIDLIRAARSTEVVSDDQ